MLSSYDKGIAAESLIVQQLIRNGYELLGRRIRTKYGEIDILAFHENTVIAIEVKQRKTIDIARECLTYRQMRRISKALQFIISERGMMFENYRIDVICLNQTGKYEHIVNAFAFETDTDL